MRRFEIAGTFEMINADESRPLMSVPFRLAAEYPDKLRMEGEGPSGAKALSQRELGNMVGAARESVNKCLNEWQRRGVLRLDDNAIAILDRPALEAMAR